jgi:hypothetical protein
LKRLTSQKNQNPFLIYSSLINKVEVIPGISDHEIVYVEASIKPRKVIKPPRKVYQYNKANTEELKEKLGSIDIEKQLKEQKLTVDQRDPFSPKYRLSSII